MTSLRAGAAVVDITPPVGGRMDGYGARRRARRGARSADGAGAGAGRRGDAAGDRELRSAGDARRRHGARARTGDRQRWSIGQTACWWRRRTTTRGRRACAGGCSRGWTRRWRRRWSSRFAARSSEAAAALRPAALKLGRRPIDTVSMNRRDPEWAIDPGDAGAAGGRRGRADRHGPELRLPRDGAERGEPDALRGVPGRGEPAVAGADRRAVRLPERRLRRREPDVDTAGLRRAWSAWGRSSADRRCG